MQTDPTRMNYQNMLEGYQLMEEKKSTLTSNWKQYEKELLELQSQLDTFQKFMASTGAESMQSHVHEENHEEEKKQPEEDKSQPNKKGQTL